MVQLTTLISIEGGVFYRIENVTIEKSWRFLTDIAKISLPRKAFPDGDINNWKNKEGNPIIKVGSKVEIQLGYDFDFQTEFVGYISKIGSETPLILECEDTMWLLKQTKVRQSYTSVSLNELLTDIIPEGIPFEISGDIALGRFYIDSVSVYQVLDKLESDYGLFSYFKGETLFVGFAYQNPNTESIALNIQREVASIQSLQYRTAQDIKVQVRAISMQIDGSKIEQTIGDADGELHTLHLPIGLNEQDLLQQAEEKIKLFRFDGYEGDIITFGQPFIEHGDAVQITDDEYPEREGVYRVDTVIVDFGINGYRRTLTLGKLATNT